MSNCMIAFSPDPSPLLAFGLPTGSEWIILLILGLLIFGRRLPEVGRSLGKTIVEFKKGIKSVEDDIDEESSKSSQKLSDDRASRRELPPNQRREPLDNERDDNPYASVEQPRNKSET